MSGGVRLREVLEDDLPTFFLHQLDPEANRMAAFTRDDPSDSASFTAHWERILADEKVTARTILADGVVVGHIAGFEREGRPEVTYWLGREHWGKGIATRALSIFLDEVAPRPVYARAARDNLGSIRVLEKCGFRICGKGRGFARARGAEIDEAILKLE